MLFRKKPLLNCAAAARGVVTNKWLSQLFNTLAPLVSRLIVDILGLTDDFCMPRLHDSKVERCEIDYSHGGMQLAK